MSAPTSKPLNIEALRLPTNFGAANNVKKLTVNVPVGKPGRTQFFQVHPDREMIFLAAIYEDKEASTTYLLTPNVASAFPDIARAVELYPAIDRQGNQRLIPVPLPGENGQRNPWHDSLLQGIHCSMGNWVRISANKSLGAYDVHVALANLPGPDWSGTKIESLVEIAFRGHIIDSVDHAVIRALQGLA
jgi:hypothetical protein